MAQLCRCGTGKALIELITEEKLNEEETRAFVKGAFRDGAVKTTGTDIDKILPAVSRFGGGNRKAKKETVIERPKAFFKRSGISDTKQNRGSPAGLPILCVSSYLKMVKQRKMHSCVYMIK